MIAKRSTRAPGSTSSFTRLVRYIARTDDRTKQAPEAVWTENCGAEDPALAAAIVEAVQALNQRSGADRTYHLIVSFAASDQVGLSDIRAIEKRLTGALGFSGHQRICALHSDTDNLHLHVAVSKIHPETLLAHSPHRDFKTLSRECAAIERDYGLDLTHSADRSRPPSPGGRHADMEAHAGIASFVSWCAERTAQPASEAGNWSELHRRFLAQGLRLKRRGGGLIVQSVGGDFQCKASAVSRSLSHDALTRRFGPFEEPPEDRAPNAPPHYSPAPASPPEARSALWAEYRDERGQAKAARHADCQERRDLLDRQKAVWREEFRAIRHDPSLNRTARRHAYAYLAKRRRQWFSDTYVPNREHGAQVRAENRLPTWSRWLEARAADGDPQAQRLVEDRRRRPSSSRPPSQDLQTWIAARNETRASRPKAGILEHRLFDGQLAGTAVFRGIRHLSGRPAALIEKDSLMLVVPISDRQAKRLRRERAVGAAVNVDRAGRFSAAPELSR